MAGATRKPAVAGRFYPADATQCRLLVEKYLSRAANLSNEIFGADSTRKILGGIAPHAGWVCSGEIAGEAIAALKKSVPDADLVVVFGAIHTPMPIVRAALDSHRSWLEPFAESVVVDDLRGGLSEKPEWFVVDDRFHLHEHAIEVELPLIEAAWPEAAILPVEVPAISTAVEIGRETAQRVMRMNRRAVFLASSDLTHYGPDYEFAPAGVGPAGLQWAVENDCRLLQRIEKFEIDAIVPEVAANRNACGAGAIAAMLAACREFGANSATVLRHTNSYETLRETHPQRPDNAVGYAAVVVG